MTDLIKTTTSDDANITIELDTLIDEVRLCTEKCRLYSKIPGIGKLERKFRAEDRFLHRVSTLRCSHFCMCLISVARHNMKMFFVILLRTRFLIYFSCALEHTVSMQII